MNKINALLKKLKYNISVLLLFPLTVKAQEVMNLYPGVIPNARQTTIIEDSADRSAALIRRVITPTLEIYLPVKENSTGTAVIICPGGSYKVLVYQGEGILTAKEFAKHGVAAFVLRYRLPNDSFVVDKSIAPLQDAQQAVKAIRDNSYIWGIDPNRIGIIGFSAGGHLASTVATHFQKPLIENTSNTSLRPDFLILVYAVISMQENLTHSDSRINLLGTQPTKDMIDNFSNELQVNEQTPPTYITHAGDDKLVDVDNSIHFYEALRHYHVPAELHIYPKGGHGFIFTQKNWMTPLFEWMETSKWISSSK